MLSYILAVVVGLIFLVADQVTKYIVTANFEVGGEKPFIEGFIKFFYVKNSGGAWGFLSGYTWVLISLTLIIMLICIALLFKYGIKNKLLFWSVTLVLSGGLGNMIDRIFRPDHMVVDFLWFEFMPSFPVFNIADCAVVLGAGLLIIYFVRDVVLELKARRAFKG